MYIYEVLRAYLEPERYNKVYNYLKILRFILNLKRKTNKKLRVLEFGGGCGQLCLLINFITNSEVHYCDLKGKISEFAEWRFRKYGANIKILYSTINNVNLPENYYDVIVSDVVIEHLKKELLRNFVKSFSDSLVNNGYIYLLWDPTYTEEYPMHILKLKTIDAIFSFYNPIRIGECIYQKSTSRYAIIKYYSFKIKHAISEKPLLIGRKLFNSLRLRLML